MIHRLWYGFRSSIFSLFFVITTAIYGLFSPLFLLLPKSTWTRYASSYSSINIIALKWICGIRYNIKGLDNIPSKQTIIIMANHQSTWETLAFASIFPTITWILKRELLNIPFFGWGLRLTQPIAIDRQAGRSAIEQVKRQGKERLESGINIVVFPEGTRVLPGKTAKYKKGGAVLSKFANKNVLPVAHNAGERWPRGHFIKTPGTIHIHIGKLIDTSTLDEEQLNNTVEQWIRQEQQLISELKHH